MGSKKLLSMYSRIEQINEYVYDNETRFLIMEKGITKRERKST